VPATTTRPVSALYIRVLGPLRVEVDGAELRLGPQQRTLLAALVLARGRIVPKEQLADTLWPGQPRSGSPITLRAHVLHLRRLLEPGRGAPYQVLVSGGARQDEGYGLKLAGTELDAARFTRLLDGARRLGDAGNLEAAVGCLDEALSLWSGPAFASLAELICAEAEARRLEELRLAAVENRIELLLALGRHRDAICSLTPLTYEYRLSEAFWAQSMLALYRLGRRADALTAYREVYAILRDELGVQPGPRLQRLHRQVLAADPALEYHRDLARSAA
jgi:DNA-binding SARP family transcriptional activator